MRIELLILLAAGLLMANVYTEGKYLKKMLSFKKYYKMAGIAFGALMIYILFKKNPLRAQQMISTTNDYIKYLPLDRGTSNLISPILDFTSKQNFAGDQYENPSFNYPVIPMPNNQQTVSENRIVQSGKKATKRSVSETKKKYVASNQNWKCGECQKQLNAWFEVDHKIRLEYGGSNHIDNLVALCRECHGKKTTIENL
jgi:5-methylcytosine-specific restriction endonuclease McrA